MKHESLLAKFVRGILTIGNVFKMFVSSVTGLF